MECGHRGQSNSGSEHVFPNHRFVGGGFFDAVRAAPATAASFEIVEHSAFRSSLFGIGSGGDKNMSPPLCFTILSPRTCRIDLRRDWTNTAPRLRSLTALFGSERQGSVTGYLRCS